MICTLSTAQAQWFSPESFGGALWGAIIGGVVGSDCHQGFSGEGAAIGAGIGLIAGTLVGEARRQNYSSAYPQAAYASGAYYQYGVGFGTATGPSAQVYANYAPNAYCAPAYYSQPPRPNYVVGGTLVGAASGALIGSASEKAGQGALIGAATGLVLGGLAEAGAQKRERNLAPAVSAQVPPPAPAPPQLHAQASEPALSASRALPPPKAASSHNRVPAPAPRHQIPDAPRVPDAPTF